MNIRPMGAELLHADRRTDGRTDMTKLIVAFRNFAKSPKNQHTHARALIRQPCAVALLSTHADITLPTALHITFLHFNSPIG